MPRNATIHGFTPAPDALVKSEDLTTALIWGIVFRYCQMNDGLCSVPQQRIADRLDIHRSTVNAKIKRLVDIGWLEDHAPDASKNGSSKTVGLGPAAQITASFSIGGVSDETTGGGVVENDRGVSDETTPSTKIDSQDRKTPSANASGGDAPLTETIDPTHPAIRAFRDAAHRYPAKSWWPQVASIVGVAEDDVEFWWDVVHAYVGNGWNPTNVRNMLHFFRRGRLPEVTPDGKTEEPKGYSAIDKFLEEHDG